MVNQLRNCGADYKNLKAVPYLPNLRFRINSKEIFPNPLLIVNSWFDKKYFRTMPIKMNKELRLLFADLEKQNEFIFIPSSPAGKSNNYVRHTKEGKKNVNQLHLEIEQELYRYLLENGISKNNIACDTLSFGGKLADIVTKNNANSYSIFEIKTDPDFRRGLREAIGQLIDYSTWENSISVNKITAVLLQTNLSENLRKFILRVKRNLIINFDVMLYDRDKKVFSII
jgi:hypothetical protein